MTNTLSTALVVAVAVTWASVTGEKVLESARVTNWGDWGIWEKCPLGQYARGMRLKTEQITYKFNEDNTALNGIQLYCGESAAPINASAFITSSYANWGKWGKIYKCPGSPGLVTGIQLRADVPRGIMFGAVKADDTAANNLRIFCDHDKEDYIEGDGTDWGFWSKPLHCDENQAICAMQTQVEYSQGWPATIVADCGDEATSMTVAKFNVGWFLILSGDDTALNNIELECCEIYSWKQGQLRRPNAIKNIRPKPRL